MENTLEIITSTSEDAVKQLNTLRLNYKNEWVFVNLNLNGLTFRFKFYNTWVQIAENPEGLRGSSSMDIKVSEFKQYLLNFLQY
jgi:hypothetical protein